MNDFDAFRLQHSKKVSFFDCYRRFFPLSHEFRGDKESFQKGKNVRKRPPKRKLRADIVKMHNWTNKSCLWKLPYAKELILPHNIDLIHRESILFEADKKKRDTYVA
jgi:hypothetical protein